jgi:hypothetical protein
VLAIDCHSASSAGLGTGQGITNTNEEMAKHPEQWASLFLQLLVCLLDKGIQIGPEPIKHQWARRNEKHLGKGRKKE